MKYSMGVTKTIYRVYGYLDVSTTKVGPTRKSIVAISFVSLDRSSFHHPWS